MLKTLKTRSLSLFQFSWTELECDVKNDQCEVKKKNSNIEIYLFMAKELGGGISYIVKRYAKPNNKYMTNYDPTKPSYT